MTPKDVELIARVIRCVPLAGTKIDSSPKSRTLQEWLADSFANVLQETNANFDRERFKQACLDIGWF